MSKICKDCNFINYRKINKYTSLILIEIGLYFGIYYVEKEAEFFQYEILYQIMPEISSSFGSCLSFILLIIYNIINKRKINKNNLALLKLNNTNELNWKKKILLILLISIIAYSSIMLNFYIWINEGDENLFVLYFIFLTLFSNLLLKTKLYRHHYFSIIVIAIVDFVTYLTDEVLIDNNETEFKYSYSLIILYIIIYCLELVLYKYYMFIKYIQSYEILFFEGLFLSVFLIITLIILIMKTEYINFWEYYEYIDPKEIIIFSSLTFLKFIYNILQLIIIDYFSPFHIILTNLIPENIVYFLKTGYETRDLIAGIVILIIDISMILLYVEFIELNFLGLSKMTKRNIELRAKYDAMNNNINDIIIDDNISLGGYELKLINEQMIDENSVTNE